MQEHELVTTKNEQAFFTALKKEGLSSDEKSQIRRSLLERIQVSKPSFFQRIAFIWPVVHSKPAFGLAVFGVLALVGVGVGKASEDALPGDVLYRAKTVVYEPVSEIFSQKDTKEEVRESIRRRLDEAKILAIQGRLGLAERLQIENLIEEDLRRLDDNERGNMRGEVILISREYSRYFLIVLKSDGLVGIQVQQASLDVIEKEAVYEDDDSVGDSEEENEEEGEEGHSRTKKENSHESQNEEDDEEEEEVEQVKKNKSGSSNTSSSQSNNEKEEEEEDEEEEESNSGSGSDSDEGDEEEEEDDEEEEE